MMSCSTLSLITVGDSKQNKRTEQAKEIEYTAEMLKES